MAETKTFNVSIEITCDKWPKGAGTMEAFCEMLQGELEASSISVDVTSSVKVTPYGQPQST